MIIHKDLEGNCLYMTVSNTDNIRICIEYAQEVTELHFNKSGIRRIMEDLQEKLNEVETNE